MLFTNETSHRCGFPGRLGRCTSLAADIFSRRRQQQIESNAPSPAEEAAEWEARACQSVSAGCMQQRNIQTMMTDAVVVKAILVGWRALEARNRYASTAVCRKLNCTYIQSAKEEM